MALKATNNTSRAANATKPKVAGKRTGKKESRVTESRAQAQRAKLDAQAQTHRSQDEQEAANPLPQHKKTIREEAQAKRRLIETLIEAYIQDHIGGNHSEKTIEWHRTALGLMRLFLQEDLGITQIEEVEADDISAWFVYLRATPGSRGKVRGERTVQTYARSARAFSHWLVRRGTIQHNPFERVAFPKVGRPLLMPCAATGALKTARIGSSMSPFAKMSPGCARDTLTKPRRVTPHQSQSVTSGEIVSRWHPRQAPQSRMGQRVSSTRPGWG